MERKCDLCGEKKHIYKFSKKELCGMVRIREEIVEKGNENEPIIKKITKWISNIGHKEGEFLYEDFKKISHGFERKTRICKNCLEKYPKLKWY